NRLLALGLEERGLPTQAELLAIALTDEAEGARGVSWARLDDDGLLAVIRNSTSTQATRLEAVLNLRSQASLADIARNHPSPHLRATAVARLDDRRLIAEIMHTDAEAVVKQAAQRQYQLTEQT